VQTFKLVAQPRNGHGLEFAKLLLQMHDVRSQA
jgi:mannose/cellobiose epimerase-like protein (N-acyl-D-glucosamine 2-epimerase family)